MVKHEAYPTVDTVRGFRIYFDSEKFHRPHLHIKKGKDWASFWLVPELAVKDQSKSVSKNRVLLNKMWDLAEEYREIALWRREKHFGSVEHYPEEPDEELWEKEKVFVKGISKFGFTLVVGPYVFKMTFEDRPYFIGATEEELKNVVRETYENLHWPEIDVDLSLSYLISPYPR